MKCFAAFSVIFWVLMASREAVSAAPIVGVVEGYYWDQQNAVNGNYGRYTLSQRLQLLSLAADYNFSVYWFAPQSVSTIDPWSATERSEWITTVTHASTLNKNVQVVYGLRPGYLDTTSINATINKLKEIQSVGITSYSLNFDDAAGAGSSGQNTAQVSLVSRLQTEFPSLNLFTFVPSNYSGTTFSDKSAWEASLATLDGINESVPMTFTGMSITPANMTVSQLPFLGSVRRTLFWDNWIAVDTSTRLPWGLIRNRDSSLWRSGAYGYILNLAFPLERVIHQLNCLKQLISSTDSRPVCDPSIAVDAWQTWLNSHGFVRTGRNPSEVKTALLSAISQDRRFASIADLEAAFPGLAGIFSTPPVQMPPTSSSASGNVTTLVLLLALIALALL